MLLFFVVTGLIIERKSPVIAIIFLNDRGQKVTMPNRPERGVCMCVCVCVCVCLCVLHVTCVCASIIQMMATLVQDRHPHHSQLAMSLL